EEADLMRDAFAEALRQAMHNPETAVVFIPSTRAADIVNKALDEKMKPQRASAYLNALGIAELRKVSRRDFDGRGWIWTGPQAPPDAKVVEFGSGLRGLADYLRAKYAEGNGHGDGEGNGQGEPG